MICSMTASMYGKRWSAIIRIAERTVGKRKPIVYRGVRYNKNKREIVLADFESNIERKLKNPSVYADEDDIEYYGCSCYEKMEAIKNLLIILEKIMQLLKALSRKVLDQFAEIKVQHILICFCLKILILRNILRWWKNEKRLGTF